MCQRAHRWEHFLKDFIVALLLEWQLRDGIISIDPDIFNLRVQDLDFETTYHAQQDEPHENLDDSKIEGVFEMIPQFFQ